MFAIWFSPEYFTIHPETRIRKTILDVFDDFVYEKITEGYCIETMAVNPQIRSCLKLYYKAIIKRSIIRRQKSDRQTDENIIPDTGITQDAFYANKINQQTQETWSSESQITDTEDDHSCNSYRK